MLMDVHILLFKAKGIIKGVRASFLYALWLRGDHGSSSFIEPTIDCQNNVPWLVY